jgi:hypothetical protein
MSTYMYCRLSRAFARVAGSVRWVLQIYLDVVEGGCLHVSRNKPITRRHRSAEEAVQGLGGGVAHKFLQRIEVFVEPRCSVMDFSITRSRF